MSDKTILITGGLGFIGSHTCVEISKTFKSIIILDDLSNSKIEVLSSLRTLCSDSQIHFFPVDLTNQSQLSSLWLDTFNIYAVVHFAGLKSVKESISSPERYYNVNINSTLNLLKVMRKAHCYNLIFSSSATVYGNNISPLVETMNTGSGITNPYGKTKYMIEEMLCDICSSENKWNIISLRYFNPIGAHDSGLLGDDPNGVPNNLMPYISRVAYQNNCKDLENYKYLGEEYDRLQIFGSDYEGTCDGTCERDFIHVVDLAKGHTCALESMHKLDGYNVYNLGTGTPSSVKQLVETFANVNNVKIPVTWKKRRSGDLPQVYCDASKAQNDLGWKCNETVCSMCKSSWMHICEK